MLLTPPEKSTSENTAKNLIRVLDDIYQEERIFNPDIARDLAEAENPHREAERKKSEVRRTVSGLIDGYILRGRWQNTLERKISKASQHVLRDGISWAFDRNIETISGMVSPFIKLNGGYYDATTAKFTIDWVHFLISYLPDECASDISIQLPRWERKTYRWSNPNSIEVLNRIITFIAHSDDYKKINGHVKL